MNLASDLFEADTKGFYTDICGYTHAIYEQYTNCSKTMHDQILTILDACDIPYFLFAGSMVGYVRNKQMPAWMDDLDIMIFEDHVERFWSIAAVELRESGFNCRPVDPPFDGGGAHILAMQLGNRRDHKIPLSDGIEKAVPWAQVDVFFSRVTEEGLVKNLKGWGLYDQKAVAAEWVFPGTMVDISDRSFRVFSDFKSDVFHEYGDVLNNIVVQTHDRVFLRARNVSWLDFEADRKKHLDATVVPMPFGLTNEVIEFHDYKGDYSFETQKGMSLTDIVKGIVEAKAGSVHLKDEPQLLFCMDLKRLFPKLKVCVYVHSIRFANHAAHLRSFIDDVFLAQDEARAHYQKVVDRLAKNIDHRGSE